MQAALAKEHRKPSSDEQSRMTMTTAQVALAQLINATAAEIAITQSGSYGINVIVNGLRWRPGDNVIIPESAYRSVAQALMRLRNEQGVQLRVIRTTEMCVEASVVASAVDERTRLVVVDQLPVFCGVPQPIAEIGERLRETAALFAVNATQAIGQLPIDVKKLGCDFLFGTSRKWLRGPRGLGFLYVRQPLIAELRPPNLGYPAGRWIDFEEYEIVSGIDRLHLGDYPYVLLAGLAAAARYAKRLGIENIAARNRMLGRRCREILSGVPGVQLYDAQQGVTATVPFNIQGVESVDTVRALLKHGIVTCVINEGDALFGLRRLGQRHVVRASFHYFNCEQEVDHLCKVLATIAETKSIEMVGRSSCRTQYGADHVEE